MREQLAYVLLAGATSVLQRIPIQWAAAAVIVASVFVGIGIHASFGEIRAYGPTLIGYGQRITDLEQYREDHEEIVTAPALLRLEGHASAIAQLAPQLERIEIILWCQSRGILESCPVQPRNPFEGVDQ